MCVSALCIWVHMALLDDEEMGFLFLNFLPLSFVCVCVCVCVCVSCMIIMLEQRKQRKTDETSYIF